MQSLTIYNPSVSDFINTDFEIEILANDCRFTEGPVWNQDGFYLFSDIPANVIYKIRPGASKEVYIFNSGTDNPRSPDINQDQPGSNGLAYYNDELLICQHGGHAIAKWEGNGLSSFIGSYNHKPFNSPNDLIVHSDGRVYFSDPPYGLKDGQLNTETYQPIAGVYCWKNNETKLICDRYQYPNGVCLSPDEKFLYICSNKPFEKFISIYETAGNNFIKILAEENSDGIECDHHGTIYLCNKDGLILLNREGERLALIPLPAVPANLCWGGEAGRDLFVTARENIFLIRDLLR